MAQNTFRQTIMSNAPLMSNAPQKTWQQPPELSPAAQLYTPGAAPTPTQAPPAMAAPAAPMSVAQAPVEQPQLNSFSPTQMGREFFANIFGGQTAPAMTEIERNQIERGINPATQVPLSERGGSSNGLISTGTSPSLSFPVSSETEAPRVSNEPTSQSLPQSQEGVANPFEQAPALGSPAPAQTMSLSQQGIADALARTKAEGVEVDPNSPQANFLREKEKLGGQPMNDEQIAQATRLAASMGTTFDPETGYSRQPFLDAQSTPQQGVQQGSGLTTVGGAPLNEFLSGAAMPEQGFARAENAMYGDNSLSRGLGGDAATKAFQDASAAREARMGLSNRPGVDVPSLAMQRSRMDAGLDPVEGAPTGTDMSQQQQRDALERGFDPATGQPIKNKEGLTFEQAMAERRQRLAEDKFDYERVNDFKAATQEEAAAISETQDAQSRDAMTGKGMKRSVLDMLDVMDNVGGRLDQFMSTDMTGKVLSFWKGSEADAQEADFAFLQSNVALKAMMELKAQSSTGSTGFGALNTKELEVLTNRFATLDPFTKPDIIRENLVRLRDQTTAMFEDAKIRHAEQYGPEAAEAVYGDLIRSTGGAKGASQQSSVPNDQNVAGKADHLFSSGKY